MARAAKTTTGHDETQHGEAQAENRKDRARKPADRDLPIARYQHLPVRQVTSKLDGLRGKDLRQIKRYEEKHRDRKTLLEEIERLQ